MKRQEKEINEMWKKYWETEDTDKDRGLEKEWIIQSRKYSLCLKEGKKIEHNNLFFGTYPGDSLRSLSSYWFANNSQYIRDYFSPLFSSCNSFFVIYTILGTHSPKAWEWCLSVMIILCIIIKYLCLVYIYKTGSWQERYTENTKNCKLVLGWKKKKVEKLIQI